MIAGMERLCGSVFVIVGERRMSILLDFASFTQHRAAAFTEKREVSRKEHTACRRQGLIKHGWR